MLITIVQIITAVALIAAILMQASGTGLGSSFGGSSSGSFHTRRGAEQAIFRFTIVLTAIFIAISIAPLVGLS